jgi:hypothetical protein
VCNLKERNKFSPTKPSIPLPKRKKNPPSKHGFESFTFLSFSLFLTPFSLYFKHHYLSYFYLNSLNLSSPKDRDPCPLNHSLKKYDDIIEENLSSKDLPFTIENTIHNYNIQRYLSNSIILLFIQNFSNYTNN